MNNQELVQEQYGTAPLRERVSAHEVQHLNPSNRRAEDESPNGSDSTPRRLAQIPISTSTAPRRGTTLP